MTSSHMKANLPRAFTLFVAITSGGACSNDASTVSVDATPGVGTDAASGDGDGGGNSSLTNWCQASDNNFGFFVTSMSAIWTISGDDINDLNGGLGGNFGGLSGADGICQEIATAAGSTRTWHAFLSATDDGTGNVANAIQRIGAGPWNDANGRLIANNIAGLLSGDRPDGDAQATDDMADECGVPATSYGNVHDVPTASDNNGMLYSTNPVSTCNDWTSSDGSVGEDPGGDGRPTSELPNSVMCGHSYPRSRNSGLEWISDHSLRGCGKGANLVQDGAGSGNCIGCGGGYGALYCFAID